eukprot:c550_g1_i1 orf=136-624(+)
MATTVQGKALSSLHPSICRQANKKPISAIHHRGLPSTVSASPLSFSVRPASAPRALCVTRAMASESTVEEKLGVRVERNPPESHLSALGVRSWPKWGCPPSKFPWTYSDKETCYLLKGKVKVYGEGSSEYVEIGAGDLVVFPKGMSCTWEVSETVDKHYCFS